MKYVLSFLVVYVVMVCLWLAAIKIIWEKPQEPCGELVEYKLDKPMQIASGYKFVFEPKEVQNGSVINTFWVWVYFDNQLVDQTEAHKADALPPTEAMRPGATKDMDLVLKY